MKLWCAICKVDHAFGSALKGEEERLHRVKLFQSPIAALKAWKRAEALALEEAPLARRRMVG
jgi:hypothetical protein